MKKSKKKPRLKTVRASLVAIKPEKDGKQEIALLWSDKVLIYELPVEVAQDIIQHGWGEIRVPDAKSIHKKSN